MAYELEVVLDGANEQFLDIDANGISVIEHPAEIKGSGLTENQIKALTDVEKNSLYISNTGVMWLCTRSITDADPTAWLVVNISVDQSMIGVLSELTTDAKGNLVSAINEVDAHTDTNTTNISNEVTRATGVEGSLSSLTTTAKNNLVAAINEVASEGGRTIIGDLSDLTTDTKANVVAAINEVDAHADTNTTNISNEVTRATGVEGSLSNLITTAKSNLVAAINEVAEDGGRSLIGELSDLTTDAKGTVVAAINEVDAHTDTNTTAISNEVTRATGVEGTLSNLTTTAKNNLVAAINEVNSEADTNASNISNIQNDVGDLSDLETTATSDLVSAINEVNAETDVIDKLNAVVVVTPSFSSLPQTFTDAQLTFEHGSHITPDLICGMYDFRLSNQSVMLPPWTINTEVEGQLTISGQMAEGSTTVKLYLRHKDVAPPEGAASVDYVGVHSIVKVELTDITELPVTFTGLTGVTAQHEALVDNYGVITPKSSANGDWSFTCGTESVTISGTFNGSTATTVKLTLCIPDNKITASAGGE